MKCSAGLTSRITFILNGWNVSGIRLAAVRGEETRVDKGVNATVGVGGVTSTSMHKITTKEKNISSVEGKREGRGVGCGEVTANGRWPDKKAGVGLKSKEKSKGNVGIRKGAEGL